MIAYRLATDDDGADLKRLVKNAGFTIENIEWVGLHPFWVVAYDEIGVRGCVQVCPGRPIGRLEMLAVDTDDPIPRARIVRGLLTNGCATLRSMGTQLVMGMIPFEMRAYKKALKKRGAVVVNQGNMLAWVPAEV